MIAGAVWTLVKTSMNISLKSAIVDVYNTCNRDIDIIRHAPISQYKKL